MFDLAVVGAGIVGTTAAWLAKASRPEWRILLLDRSLAGRGASAFSAGLVFPYGRTPEQKRLTRLAGVLYGQLRNRMPGLPIRDLALVGVVSRANAAAVGSRFTEPVRLADTHERNAIFKREPFLRISPEEELLIGSSGAIGCAAGVASRIASEFCDQPDTQCQEGVSVTSVRRSGDGLMLSTGDGRTIDARRVLIAIGPWLTDGVGGSLAKALGVRTKKVAALHVLRRPAPDSPVFYFFDEDAFLLPAADRGEWILSFTSREWDCEPDISKLYIRPEERESALAILQRYCPSLAPDCLGGGRVFCDAYTKDWAPLIQDDPELPGCAIAGGCSGAGFRLAPAIGAEALRKITNSDTRLASACKEAALA